MMDPEFRKLLDDNDYPEADEYPPNFDWDALQARVSSLKAELERITAREFEHNDGVQDATFCADLSLERRRAGNVVETVFALRFSNFGDLFTTWHCCSSESLLENTVSRVISEAEVAGFKFVPPKALESPYDGRCSGFFGKSWWYRYFDYT